MTALTCDLCGGPFDSDGMSRFEKGGICSICASRERRGGGYWHRKTRYKRDRYDGVDPFHEMED